MIDTKKKYTKEPTRYLGIDQSFTSTGYVVLEDLSGDSANDQKDSCACNLIDSGFITSKTGTNTFVRALLIAEELQKIAIRNHVSYICIEGLAFSSNSASSKDLAGLQYVIMVILMKQFMVEEQIKIVAPTTLKKFATDYGKASKEDMLAKICEKHKSELLQNYKKKNILDISDAYFLAKYAKEYFPWYEHDMTDYKDINKSINKSNLSNIPQKS